MIDEGDNEDGRGAGDVGNGAGGRGVRGGVLRRHRRGEIRLHARGRGGRVGGGRADGNADLGENLN